MLKIKDIKGFYLYDDEEIFISIALLFDKNGIWFDFILCDDRADIIPLKKLEFSDLYQCREIDELNYLKNQLILNLYKIIWRNQKEISFGYVFHLKSKSHFIYYIDANNDNMFFKNFRDEKELEQFLSENEGSLEEIDLEFFSRKDIQERS